MSDSLCEHRWTRARTLGPPQQECCQCEELRPFPEHAFRPEVRSVPDLVGRTVVICRDCGADREAAVHGPGATT